MVSVRNSQINITIAADNKLSYAATILFKNNHRMEARLALEIFKHFAGCCGKF